MEQKLEKRVRKLERIIYQLILVLQSSPALNQHQSENLMKMLGEEERDDNPKDVPEKTG